MKATFPVFWAEQNLPRSSYFHAKFKRLRQKLQNIYVRQRVDRAKKKLEDFRAERLPQTRRTGAKGQSSPSSPQVSSFNFKNFGNPKINVKF